MFQHTVKVKRIFNSRYRIIPLSVSPFTLIELIISTSFAVIAVAMLIPALRQAEEMSRRTECAFSLRQIHIAMDMYALEYNDWYPQVDASSGRTSRLFMHQGDKRSREGFVDAYMDGVHGITYYGCPSADYRGKPAQKSEEIGRSDNRLAFQNWVGPHSNWRAGGSNSPQRTWAVREESADIATMPTLTRRHAERGLGPAVHVMMSDRAAVRVSSGRWYDGYHPQQNHYGGSCGNCDADIPAFANMIFIDGHLKGFNEPAREHPLNQHARRWAGDYHWSCKVMDNENLRSNKTSGMRAAGKKIIHSEDGRGGTLNCEQIPRRGSQWSAWPW